MPKPESILVAFEVGLMSDARPDFRALAPSDALIPPSRIAVRKNAKSLTSPPSCWITGAAFGIAVVRSSIDVTVWFSTALRKLISPRRSFVAVPKALVNEIVVSRALLCSTLPKTDKRVASATCARRSAPCLPVAAAVAAISMVSLIATPYLVNSFARF